MTDKMGGNETDFNIISFVLRFTFEECVFKQICSVSQYFNDFDLF